jgi:hypothetical protein
MSLCDSPRVLSRRANTTCEHKIELLRLSNLIVGIRIFDAMCLTELAQFGARVVIELSQRSLVVIQ